MLLGLQRFGKPVTTPSPESELLHRTGFGVGEIKPEINLIKIRVSEQFLFFSYPSGEARFTDSGRPLTQPNRMNLILLRTLLIAKLEMTGLAKTGQANFPCFIAQTGESQKEVGF